MILQDISRDRLRALAGNPSFVAEVERLGAARRAYLEAPGWFATAHGAGALSGIAYFSMEFRLGEGLTLYAGGLGILAGDYLKTASDFGIPVIGIGLLYQEGYFRQLIDAVGAQHEAYPYNDPGSLPIQPARDADGGWLHIHLDLPGRPVELDSGTHKSAAYGSICSTPTTRSTVRPTRGITGKSTMPAARSASCRKSCSASPAGARSRRSTPEGTAMLIADMTRGEPVIGTTNGHIYAATALLIDRPRNIPPCHSGVRVPTELALILWQK